MKIRLFLSLRARQTAASRVIFSLSIDDNVPSIFILQMIPIAPEKMVPDSARRGRSWCHDARWKKIFLVYFLKISLYHNYHCHYSCNSNTYENNSKSDDTNSDYPDYEYDDDGSCNEVI